MKIRLLLIWTVLSHSLLGQVSTTPTLPKADDAIKIVYDATLGTSGLVGAAKVYMHSGVILSSETGTGWQNVVGNWGMDDGIGEMTKVTGESDKWEITISPRTYFNVPGNPIYRIGMVFRNVDGSKEGKTDSNSDIFVDILQTDFGISLTSPSGSSLFVDQSDQIQINAVASELATFELFVNDVSTNSQANVDTYSYTHTASESSGSTTIKVTATNGVETAEKSFTYTIKEMSPVSSLPAGIVRGINYDPDNSKVILCLEAPLKSSAYIVGDFNNWVVSSSYLMNRDGDFFWLEVTGLTANIEYGFQYVVDQSIYVADPFADKILDPEDNGISNSIYPNLQEYPANAYRDLWYHQRVSVLETNQTDYQWNVTNFQKPQKDELVIYELLIRDYFGSGQQSYQSLIDTLSYLSKLGINAIELMPIMEFNGNSSWGYNPTFKLAPDKAYGTKNDLKEFIDKAHELGIAVIFDIVMNHHDIPAPYAIMYFDGQITAENPWFNISAPHPYSVFFDFNHESEYTKNYMDSVNLYWLEEYKIDGYRFDLSKGFTQTNSTESTMGNYDATRIATLKRMADQIWNHTADTYVILEHFADSNEETELSDYGMMLWANLNNSYSQLAMGYSSQSNISGVAASQRGWTSNNLIGYMESHDEERMLYRCAEFGNGNSNYTTKDYSTALERVMAASAFFYTIPGPKMLWQLVETGFDYSINRCSDGSIDGGCRLSIKPTTWQYLQNVENQNLFEVTSSLINLKTSYGLFQTGEVTFFNNSGLGRYIWITQNALQNPMDPSEMNSVIIGNFDITEKNVDVSFPHNGKWYHYFDLGDSVDINSPTTFTLQPGEFRIYTDVKLTETSPELMTNLNPMAPTNLIATDEVAGVSLSWNDNSSINTGYLVYRKSGSSDWVLAETLSDVTSFIDKGIVQNETYDYQVSAFNAIGERLSNEISVTATNFVLGAEGLSVEALFPNPSTNLLFIDSEKKYTSFSVSDLSGKTVLQGSLRNQDEYSIEISSLAKGHYILNLSDGRGGSSLVRFIKD